MSKKKSPFRKPTGERPLFVRILAIAIVLFLAFSMLITFLPSFVFSETGSNALESANALVEIDDAKRDPNGRPPLVIDAADILTDQEEREIETGLQSFRDEQDFDIVVLTVYSLEGYGVVEYADIFYDQYGYGGGDEHDGALIIVSTEHRDWTMITSGYGIDAITDYGLDLIEDEILPMLSSGRYADAFKTFGDKCAYYVREARAGNIIDEYIYDDEEEGAASGSSAGSGSGKGEFPLAMNLGASGIIGLVFSLFRNGRRKAELKSVHQKTQAKDYMRAGSLDLREKRDRYLYSTVSRVPIKQEEDDDHRRPGHFGGSTIHMSPGGHFHGGGKPGKF